MDCDNLVSAGFVVEDHLDAELTFPLPMGLEASGFLVAADAVVDFLVSAVEGGRLTSFLAAAAAAVLVGCGAVVLPVDGAVVILEAAALVVAEVEGLVVPMVGLDVVDVVRDVEEPVAGLVVFDVAAPTVLVVVEVLGLGAAEATVLLAAAVVLGLATFTVSAAGLFLRAPFTDVLVPFVTVAAVAEVVLAGPADFFSGTLGWFLAVVETAAAPTGLLGTAPAAADFAAVVVAVFLPAAAEELFAGLTSVIVRCEAVPSRELDPETPADLAVGCVLVPTAFGLTLGSAPTVLPLAFGAGLGAASFAASSA